MREVPELMERTPQEARQRWLRLTGRLGGGINGEGGREEERGDRAPGSPALDTFYVQVGSATKTRLRPRHTMRGQVLVRTWIQMLCLLVASS